MSFAKIVLVGLGILIFTAALALAFGRARWRDDTDRLVASVKKERQRGELFLSRDAEIVALPPVAQAYFRAVLSERFSVIRAVSMRHMGEFNMGETTDRWVHFASKQKIVTSPPAFIWDARMQMMPGLGVYVRDAYVREEGILKPSLLGLFALTDIRGGGAIAQGELMRFLAESPWYPTALLPSQGVTWDAMDDHSAKATLVNGPNVVSLIFHFGSDGLVDSVRAEARGRTVGGRIVPTPWEGRWTNYMIHDRVRVPMSGEVAWDLPNGRKPYWRGKVVNMAFDFD